MNILSFFVKTDLRLFSLIKNKLLASGDNFHFKNVELRLNEYMNKRLSYRRETALQGALKYDLSHGIKIWTDLSTVLSQFTRVTDRRKDGHNSHR